MELIMTAAAVFVMISPAALLGWGIVKINEQAELKGLKWSIRGCITKYAIAGAVCIALTCAMAAALKIIFI